MRFAIRDHQLKGRPFAQALTSAGHTQVPLGQPADVFLTDNDIDVADYRALIDHYEGSRVVMYPHGAQPALNYDGIYEPDPRVDVRLVPAQGHVDVMRAYGLDVPTEIVGFPFCPQRPFKTTEPRRVLFASSHPYGSGWLGEQEQLENATVFAALLRLCIGIDVELTVRHVGSLEQNCIWPVGDVRYVQGTLNLDYSDIDHADVVVAAHGTYSHMAVARGKPTVVYGQEIHPYEGEDAPRFVENWELYRKQLRYPYDALEGLERAIERACAEEAAEWRERFVGEPFDAHRVCSLVTPIGVE